MRTGSPPRRRGPWPGLCPVATTASWPAVPLVFCETRPLAEEWTYRFLAAAWHWARAEPASQERSSIPDLVLPGAPDQPEPSVAEVRAWARTGGLTVPDGGRLRPEIWAAWRKAHQPTDIEMTAG